VNQFNAIIKNAVRVSSGMKEMQKEVQGGQRQWKFVNLPDNSHIEVRDPRGEPLLLKDKKPMQPIQGDGNLEFLLRGAGVYLAQISATYRKSVNGAGRLPVRDTSSVSVSVN
jgi:hypothetical protein